MSRRRRTGRPIVTIVAEGFPTRGGVATFAETIVGDPRLKHDFDLRFCNTARGETRRGGNLSLANISAAAVDAWRVLRASQRSDLVHLQLMGEPGLPLVKAAILCAAARAGGAGVLAHSHSATGNAGRPDVAVYGRLDRTLLRAWRLADRVLTVSEPGASYLAAITGAEVEVVDNAVDVSAVGRSLGGSERPAVVFVGTLCRRKGVPELAQAAAVLDERGITDWELVLVGGQGWTPGDEYIDVCCILEECGVADSSVGAKAPDEVAEILHRADIFALPSYLEGQPIAIIEAMARGIPVVSTRVGAIPDQVRHDREGLIVEPGDVAALADALEALITSPERRAELGEAARRRAEERYDLPRLSARLRDVYERVLVRRGRLLAPLPVPSRSAEQLAVSTAERPVGVVGTSV